MFRDNDQLETKFGFCASGLLILIDSWFWLYYIFTWRALYSTMSWFVSDNWSGWNHHVPPYQLTLFRTGEYQANTCLLFAFLLHGFCPNSKTYQNKTQYQCINCVFMSAYPTKSNYYSLNYFSWIYFYWIIFFKSMLWQGFIERSSLFIRILDNSYNFNFT